MNETLAGFRGGRGWYFCWLIELRGTTPMWWAAEGGWEKIAHDALWFARREDADRFASEMSQDVFVSEHGFDLAAAK